jgi:polyvinyl alcohol dehydrogenase (cytochrome)
VVADVNGSNGNGGVQTAAAAGEMPCDVADVVQRACVYCHGTQLRRAAPITLMTPADFQTQRNGRTVAEAAAMRIVDPLRPMPPPPDPPLGDADLQTLDAWLAAGAPADAQGCAVQDVVDPDDGSGTTGTSTADAGVPPTMVDPPPTTGDGTVSGPRWTLFGHDLNNSRSNPDETTLTAETVGGMRQLWQVPVQGSTSTPAVADGIVYLPAWDGQVHALRLEDGGSIWSAQLPDLIDSSPALSPDHVFVSDDNGSVHALDRQTGDVVWSTELDPHPETHLWSSPVFVPEADLIVIGVASGEEALNGPTRTFRGSVVGLDATSGSERFRFDTTSGGPSGAGIAVWATAAVDPDRKWVFIGTGNNYTEPTGPYADSMLAIDYETGELVWSTQFTEDDVFVVGGGTGPDYDIGSSANLFSAGGKDLVGIGVKSGVYYALDRETGVIEWTNMVSQGSVLGGVISASAYADGLIFVASNVSFMGNTRVAAIEADTGSTLWTHEVPTTSYGGVAHAGGVVYVGVTSGTIYALDAVSGNELWSDDLPNAIAGGPSVVDGKLLVPWGYQWTLREGTPVTGGLVAYGL